MKTYIINVSTNEVRRNHMLNLISQNHCLTNSLFIHKGDLNSINNEVLNKYFGGELKTLSPAVSCAYKHILAYSEFINDVNTDYALILEDDIFFYQNFSEKIEKIIDEIKLNKIENFIISLEDSNLKYVKGSEIKKNKTLYKKSAGRMAGAYLIDKVAAKNMINEIENNKCNLAIDWFHNYCSDNNLLDIYWAHPALAIQGSLNGKIKSLIDNKQFGLIKIWKFKISKLYKKLLYNLK